MTDSERKELEDFDVNFDDVDMTQTEISSDDLDINFDEDDESSLDAQDSTELSDLDDIDLPDEETESEEDEFESTESLVNDEEVNFSEDEASENEESAIEEEKQTEELEVEQETSSDKSSKKGKGLFGKKVEDEKVIDLILYIVADKAHAGMVNYCRNYGANVSKVFTNIAEARDTMLMQVEPFRVIVIDSGTGRFTNMGSRKELIDLLGICDVDTRITVFYTDSAIKTDVELSDEVEDKRIHWYKYRSTPDIVAHILQNSKKEHYVLDSSDEDIDEIPDESILNFTALPVKEGKKMDIGKPSISVDDIVFNMMNNESNDEELPKYEIKIKM